MPLFYALESTGKFSFLAKDEFLFVSLKVFFIASIKIFYDLLRGSKKLADRFLRGLLVIQNFLTDEIEVDIW